jgi:hypothetical protein
MYSKEKKVLASILSFVLLKMTVLNEWACFSSASNVRSLKYLGLSSCLNIQHIVVLYRPVFTASPGFGVSTDIHPHITCTWICSFLSADLRNIIMKSCNDSRTSFCDGSIYDDSLLRPLSSRTKHSRLVVHPCRNSSVLSSLVRFQLFSSVHVFLLFLF